MIDKYGEGIYPDLISHYDVDLIEAYREWEMGAGPSPSLLVSLISALPEGSMTKALMRGGREFFGWGQAEHALAALFDAVNTNTQVSGTWKNKPPKFPQYPVPKVRKADAPKKKVTVADLYASFHAGR